MYWRVGSYREKNRYTTYWLVLSYRERSQYTMYWLVLSYRGEKTVHRVLACSVIL
jgi:hypothetical protein